VTAEILNRRGTGMWLRCENEHFINLSEICDVAFKRKLDNIMTLEAHALMSGGRVVVISGEEAVRHWKALMSFELSPLSWEGPEPPVEANPSGEVLGF